MANHRNTCGIINSNSQSKFSAWQPRTQCGSARREDKYENVLRESTFNATSWSLIILQKRSRRTRYFVVRIYCVSYDQYEIEDRAENINHKRRSLPSALSINRYWSFNWNWYLYSTRTLDYPIMSYRHLNGISSLSYRSSSPSWFLFWTSAS